MEHPTVEYSNDPKQYYVNRKELMAELKKYKKTKRISEELGKMLLDIATKLSSKKNFSGYTYRDEFISSAVYRMIEQLDKINLDHPKCNPFAYLTQICKFKMIAKINSERRYQNLKDHLVDEYLNDFESTNGVYIKKTSDNPDDLTGFFNDNQ